MSQYIPADRPAVPEYLDQWPTPSDRILFFFNDTATTEIYTLSLHDALPIYTGRSGEVAIAGERLAVPLVPLVTQTAVGLRSEEHTSELQSRSDLVCRLLLEKKKKQRHPAAEHPMEARQCSRSHFVRSHRVF